MRLTLLLLTFVSALSCNAQIGADQARDIAARFFADNNLCNDAPRRKCARKDTMPKLVYTAKTYGKADYYVFHRNEQGNGFVIVNAHGTCEEPAVIGYAHEGSFDIDNIPPAFAWCLSQYQQCGIAWRSNGAAEKWSGGEMERRRSSAHHPMEPAKALRRRYSRARHRRKAFSYGLRCHGHGTDNEIPQLPATGHWQQFLHICVQR